MYSEARIVILRSAQQQKGKGRSRVSNVLQEKSFTCTMRSCCRSLFVDASFLDHLERQRLTFLQDDRGCSQRGLRKPSQYLGFQKREQKQTIYNSQPLPLFENLTTARYYHITGLREYTETRGKSPHFKKKCNPIPISAQSIDFSSPRFLTIRRSCISPNLLYRLSLTH